MMTRPPKAAPNWRLYLTLLRIDGGTRAFVAGLASRLSLTMTPMAVLLLVERVTGSYATAGLAAGAYGLGSATTGPLLARRSDRVGARPVLIVAAVLHSAVLVCLALSASHATGAVLVALSGVAGLTLAPLSGIVRALWTRLTEDEVSRRGAYALDSAVIEALFALGPFAVGTLAARLGDVPALVTSALLHAGGTAALAAHPATTRPRQAAANASMADPLRAPALRRLLATVSLLYVAFGIVKVAVPAFTQPHGGAATAGELLGLWSAAGAAAGLAYGAVRWRRSTRTQFPYLVCLIAVGLLPLALAPDTLTLAGLLAVGSVGIAPTMAAQYTLVGDITPDGGRTEAFAWVSCVWFAGTAVGNALGGVAISLRGPSAAFATAAAVAAAAALSTRPWYRAGPASQTGRHR